jgi:hypothetical protein
MTFIPFMTCIMTILYHVFISFIPGIRDADILLEHCTETPELNVEAVTHAENRLRLTVTTPCPRFMLLYPLYPLYPLYVL